MKRTISLPAMVNSRTVNFFEQLIQKLHSNSPHPQSYNAENASHSE